MQEKASQIGRLSQFIDKFCFLLYNNSALMGGRDDTIHGRRFGGHFRKEVHAMRITLHIGAFTVTIIVKRRENRHSGK